MKIIEEITFLKFLPSIHDRFYREWVRERYSKVHHDQCEIVGLEICTCAQWAHDEYIYEIVTDWRLWGEQFRWTLVGCTNKEAEFHRNKSKRHPPLIITWGIRKDIEHALQMVRQGINYLDLDPPGR